MFWLILAIIFLTILLFGFGIENARLKEEVKYKDDWIKYFEHKID